jgi:hypothetical protein
VTAVRVLRSEWTKFRSLRSTVYVLVAAVVLAVGIGAFVPWANAQNWREWSRRDRQNFDPTNLSLSGLYLSQLAVGVLGVLMMSGEYATGMIRASLTAVPKRLPVLWAKVAVFGTAVLGLTAVTSLIAFFIGQWPLAARHLGASLADPGVAASVAGAALYLTLIGLLGVGLGGALRNTAAGIAGLVTLVLVIPVIVQTFPRSWRVPLQKFMPSSIADSMTRLVHDPDAYSRWTSCALLCGYVLIALVAATVVLRRRDA